MGGAELSQGDGVATNANDVLTGLTDREVVERRTEFGDNQFSPARTVPAWRRLLAELTHFFALLLWVAAVLAFIAGLPELTVAIALVVVINALFAFAQERKAEHAAAAMQDLVPRKVLVRRNGEQRQVPAAELVVDDIVLLVAGDRVPADGVVAEAHSLELNTSLITGESIPVELEVGDGRHRWHLRGSRRGGDAVTAVGAHTRLSGLADLTRSVDSACQPARPGNEACRPHHRHDRHLHREWPFSWSR